MQWLVGDNGAVWASALWWERRRHVEDTDSAVWLECRERVRAWKRASEGGSLGPDDDTALQTVTKIQSHSNEIDMKPVSSSWDVFLLKS